MKALKSLRAASFVEGLSLLALLFVAMPLKYIGGMPAPTRVVGLVHGVLFLALLGSLARAYLERTLTLGRALTVLALALLPFGFVVADRRLRSVA